MKSMFVIISTSFKNLAFSLGKFLISMKSLLNAGDISGSNIEFPFTLRGKGKIRFNGNILIRKHAYIRYDGNLTLGNDFRIGEDSQLIVDENSLFDAGKRLVIEKDCIVRSAAYVGIGEKVFIASGTSIFSREKGYGGNLLIGNNSSIGNNSLLDISGDLVIGSDVALGPGCTIYTHNHDYRNGQYPLWKGNVVVKSVEIANGAWVGANVTILPGVRIGKSAIVGAGSVVTKSVEDFQAVAGNPAKPIGGKVPSSIEL